MEKPEAEETEAQAEPQGMAAQGVTEEPVVREASGALPALVVSAAKEVQAVSVVSEGLVASAAPAESVVLAEPAA